MARLFISYSRRDEAFARLLAEALSGLGIEVWIDIEDIPVGMKWSSAIQGGLDVCDALIVIVSPYSVSSRNVEDEWQYYLDQSKPVIPVIFKSAKMHFQLNRIQYVDFDTQDFESAFNQLQIELKKTMGTNLSQEASVVERNAYKRVQRHAGLSRRRRWITISVTITLVVIVGLILSTQYQDSTANSATDVATTTPTDTVIGVGSPTSPPVFLTIPSSMNRRGGSIIEGSQEDTPSSLNPLFCSDTVCSHLIRLLFPKLLGIDPETGMIQPNVPGSLVVDWSMSTDGLTYTFSLRDDWNWTDGTPITSNDIVYAWNAITSGVIVSPLDYLVESISSVEASDLHTLVITFKSPDCTSLRTASSLPVIPSHLFTDDYAMLANSDFNLNPSVTAGIFQFAELRTGEYVRLTSNQDYPDAQNEFVSPDEYLYRVMEDSSAVDEFLDGNINLIINPPETQREDIRTAAETGGVQVFEYPGTFYSYLAFNLADPANPESGLDEDGSPIDQGHHPIFGDQRVRRAIALSINVDELRDNWLFGEATRMASNLIPTSWAYDSTLPPLPYSPDSAATLLDEAGWIDEDRDGIREAHHTLYAEEGSHLQFTIYTNQGNTAREAAARMIQDQLSQIGISVEVTSLDFNTLLELVYEQRFDTFLLGWNDSLPHDPDQTDLFLPSADTPGLGSNFTSYNNPEVTESMRQARVLPGCDAETRTEIYHRIQRAMQDDPPYVWLFAQNGMYAVRSNIHGFNPYPNQPYWNIAEWFITP